MRSEVQAETEASILQEYEFHPESKCADESGEACGKQTVGLLTRRHIVVRRIRFIGKESNALEDVDAGMVHDAADAYVEYPDPSRSEWQTIWLPKLKAASLKMLVQLTGMSRRALIDLRAGRSVPHPQNEARIIEVLKSLDLAS